MGVRVPPLAPRLQALTRGSGGVTRGFPVRRGAAGRHWGVSGRQEWEGWLRSSYPTLGSVNVALSHHQQRRRRSSIDPEEQLEAAYLQAAATLAAAKDVSAQARSVRRGVTAVLSRVGESLKRGPAPPPSG